MFEKIVMKLARAKGPMTCPKCREKAGRAVVAEMVVTCEACGYRGSLSEWAMRGVEQELSGGLADPDRPPEGTRITRRELGGDSVAWEVPPSGRGGGLLGFGILWTGLVAVFSAFWVPAAIRGEVEGNMPQWMGVVFLVPFWAVGLGMLYFGLRFKYARHLVVVDLRQVVLVRSLFNRSKRRTLARKTLQAVEKREFYQQNYQPVHGIELRGDDGKLRFGTTLSEEEKNWLVADIRRTIWPSGTRGEMYGGEAAGGGAAGGGPRLSMPVGRSFTVDLPPPGGAGRWAVMVIGLIVVGGFIAIGILLLEDAGFFRSIWLGFNGLFALGMLAGMVSMIRNAGVVTRVSGDRSEIRVQRMKGRRMTAEKRMPREGVEVRSFSSGRSNQTRMKRVELVGPNEMLPVVRWRAEGEVDPFVEELRTHLGG